MEDRIKEKLNLLLKELPFTKEYQVAYLLVEIRKLLDRIGQRTKYAYVRFFCDWILHTEKSQNLDIISDDFERIAADLELQAEQSIVQLILSGAVHPFAEFTDFVKLKLELRSLFSENGITDNLTIDDGNWCSLRNLLFRGLADQPIDFKNKPVRGIKSLRFNEVREDLYGCFLTIEFIEDGKLLKKRFIFADDEPNFKITSNR